MVRFGGVIVDCGGGLGAEIARLGVELESADGVGTMSAVELHAALDALDSISFHCLNCSPIVRRGRTRWWGSQSNFCSVVASVSTSSLGANQRAR